jgi:hypothetical protein
MVIIRWHPHTQHGETCPGVALKAMYINRFRCTRNSTIEASAPGGANIGPMAISEN